MAALRVRRTMNIQIDGDKDIVDELARKTGTAAFADGRVRCRIEQRLDVLDDDGNVFPPEAIIEELRRRDG